MLLRNRMQKIIVIILGLLGVQTVTMAHDFQIVRGGWLQCESEDDLHQYADAKDEKAIFQLMADHLERPRCISNLSIFRIENVVDRRTPKGNPYSCFVVNDILAEDQYQSCTAQVFISSIVREINTRSGLYEITEQHIDGVMARCVEGGTVRVHLRNGAAVRRESRVFSNIFLGPPPVVNVSDPLWRVLVDGCRGGDFQKLIVDD